ncbi:MAG: RNA polymerase sporulation sigma factor SigH [Ruminococcaceae bacterium]|nr:RNA polymerase sporulation sigma factor SigH [Oscillospiraceae bacterium]
MQFGRRIRTVPENSLFQTDSENREGSHLSDEELVLLAKNGDTTAIELLVNRYKNFVRARSKSYFLVGADREDLIQEGMIGLYKAILSFNASRNVSFKTFAELCVTRHIISAVKMSTRQKHMPLNSYISLNKTDTGMDYIEYSGYSVEKSESNPEQIMIEKEDIIGIEGQIDKALSAFEAEVLMYYLSGMSYGRIAVCMNRDVKSVDNALQRIKRKLEKVLSR